MIQFTVGIDTLKLQVEFYQADAQRAVLHDIATALKTTYSYLHIGEGKIMKGLLVREVHTAGAKILEIKSGSYLRGSYRDTNRTTVFYVSVEIAGLKSYNTKIDTISLNCLIRVCGFLNTNNLDFFYTGIDICVDMSVPFNHTYAFCNKIAPRVKWYKVGDLQPYTTTHYIEKYDHTHHNVMKRSYIYDKSKKQNINYPLTRFELKLQSRFFNRYHFGNDMLQQQLDKYHILYFPTLQEKDAALSLYAVHEDTIRRRDLHLLGLDRYRIYPDVSEINNFLFNLYNVYEHDLNLPVVVVDNTFDFE